MHVKYVKEMHNSNLKQFSLSEHGFVFTESSLDSMYRQQTELTWREMQRRSETVALYTTYLTTARHVGEEAVVTCSYLTRALRPPLTSPRCCPLAASLFLG